MTCCVAEWMRQKRPLLVAISLSIHLVVVLGLFIAGFWNIEQLDAPRRTIDLAVAPPPPPAPSGSPSAGEHEPFKKKQKKPRVIPKVITQPELDKAEPEKPTTTSTPSTGDGGTGSGSGSGSGTDPKGTGDCVGDHCGPAVADKPEAKEPIVERGPEIVIPEVIKGMRLRGQTQIQMPDVEKTTLMRSGKTRATATLKVCVSATGSIMSLDMFRGSGLPGWDAAILAAVRKWEYQAHRVGKTFVPVCGMVTFLYEIR